MAELKTLVEFNGDNGSMPLVESLATDASGNLLGTTYLGGPANDGVVFEIAKTTVGYNSVPTTLASFDGIDGARPYAGVVVDPSGNLFGTTVIGGPSNDGTVFELTKTATGYSAAPTTLVSFSGHNGANPRATPLIDPHDNLIGTANEGGRKNNGTVYEIVKTATGYEAKSRQLVFFNGTNGSEPSPLISDSRGNLFGTTSGGGSSNYGTVFEIKKTVGGYAHRPATLASLTSANAGPLAGVTADPSGNLFGTTVTGGTAGSGSVFEIPKTAAGYGAVTTLASFNGANGYNPSGKLIIDASGDLFGTTGSGGPGPFSSGTVFEIAKTKAGYASATTTLASFNGSNGATPAGGLIADSQGNLFGTTVLGGPSNDGTVFEITDSGYTVACFREGTSIGASRSGHVQDVAVENLRIGDLVVTASGSARPIRWLGRRVVDCASQTKPYDVWPIRICAGAFGIDARGVGVPERDLYLSPGHLVLVGPEPDEVLVPIMCLVNGTSIARVPVASVTYWHIELDSHDILLAEGLPTESFFDMGSRPWFEDGVNDVRVNPDMVSHGFGDRCRPVAVGGPVVEAERMRLDFVFASRLVAQCDWPIPDEAAFA